MAYYDDLLGGQPLMLDLASWSPHPLAFCKATVSIRRVLFLFVIPIMELFERYVKTFPVRIFQYVQGSCQRRKHGKQHQRLCVWGCQRAHILLLRLVPIFFYQKFLHMFCSHFFPPNFFSNDR